MSERLRGAIGRVPSLTASIAILLLGCGGRTEALVAGKGRITQQRGGGHLAVVLERLYTRRLAPPGLVEIGARAIVGAGSSVLVTLYPQSLLKGPPRLEYRDCNGVTLAADGAQLALLSEPKHTGAALPTGKVLESITFTISTAELLRFASARNAKGHICKDTFVLEAHHQAALGRFVRQVGVAGRQEGPAAGVEAQPIGRPRFHVRRARWGWDVARVRDSEEGAPASERAGRLTYLARVGGLPVRIEYDFRGGALFHATLMATSRHESPAGYVGDYRRLKTLLAAKLGPAQGNTVGEAIYRTTWTTRDTRVTLLLDSAVGQVGVTYDMLAPAGSAQ